MPESTSQILVIISIIYTKEYKTYCNKISDGLLDLEESIQVEPEIMYTIVKPRLIKLSILTVNIFLRKHTEIWGS